MERCPTMQVIAEELGVSRLTVSSVINGRAAERRISPATVERVRSYLEERGYVPSRRALDLRSKQTDVLGILHTGHLYSHLTEAFNRLVDALNQTPKRLEIVVVRREDIARGVRELIARGVAGLVWIQRGAPREELDTPSLLNYLTHVTAVVYNYHFGDGDCDDEFIRHGVHLIGIDRLAGYRKAASLLRRLGHRAVAIPDRVEGEGGPSHAEQALAEADIRAVRTLPRDPCASHDLPGGRVTAEGILGAMRREGLTAACFNDDELAGFAVSELVRRGVRIPHDLTVTGFDGLEIGAAFGVPLTTIRVPVGEMVERAVRVLARPGKARANRFDTELVLRASHGRAKRGDSCMR